MDIFWLGLEALPREIRATEWRSWVKAPSDVRLLSRTWKTRRYQSGGLSNAIRPPLKKVPKAFLWFYPKYTFGTFSSGEGPKSSYFEIIQFLGYNQTSVIISILQKNINDTFPLLRNEFSKLSEELFTNRRTIKLKLKTWGWRCRHFGTCYL